MDLIGQKFNKLTVIEDAGIKNRKHYWVCQCDCSNIVTVEQSKLKSGHTKSCGCLRRNDLTGQRFGRLTVTEFDRSEKDCSGNVRTYWKCVCDCSNECVVRSDHLTTKNTRSCGCYEEDRSLLPPPLYTQEEIDKKLKNVYRWIIRRCYSPNVTKYYNYGGRGIAVCDRWRGKDGRANFIHDMGNPPSLLHQIDRIDNEGDYSPENCRWVTNKENSRNKRDNNNITYNGKTQCLSAWAEELGINKSTLRKRIELDWDLDRIMTAPVDKSYSRSKKAA